MSATAPIIASSSSTISLPSREMTGSRLFQFYMESFFKIPKDLKNDLVYCQRALKAHIKVHQMVLDVFQQQPDADPQQKKRIVDELEAEIYEINTEQNFLFLRLRRIIDEFYKMLKKNGIPTDPSSTNALVSREIVPLIGETSLEIVPVTVLYRNTEEKLIEKYFEVQKDQKQLEQEQQEREQWQQQQKRNKQQQKYQAYNTMEVIDLDNDDGVVMDKLAKVHGKYRGSKREHPSSSSSGLNGNESLLRNYNVGFNAAQTQPSLLKPINQRGVVPEMMTMDVKPKINKTVTTLGDIYKQKKERKEKGETQIELPVSTNVKMSRLNLRQALKRAQAAVRGPLNTAIIPHPPPPPPAAASAPPPAPTPQPKVVNTQNIEVFKKTSLTKTKAMRGVAATTAIAKKSPERSSSSEEGTPERGPTPPHNYWPDELEETRTKADEYGQEMFLRMFDLFTPETHALMQQRRSKRRRRCVQNINYHYGRIEHPPSTTSEPDAKKKRKAFLLSPQVKKALPPPAAAAAAKPRAKRRSADNVSETSSVPPSRSASSSPDDKRSCNECLKGGYNLEQCEECKLHYHAQCHRENDSPTFAEDPKKVLNETKQCPTCKRKNDKILKQKISINKNLQCCAQELDLQLAKEKDRREILQRTGKSYKIQMNNLFKIVNAFKTEKVSTATTSSTSNYDNADDVNDEVNKIIHLD